MSATDLDSSIVAEGRRSGRAIYTWVAVAAALVVLGGFSRTYYAKAAFGTPELSLLQHLHGLVMTAWFVLFAVQVRIAAANNVRLHRKVGTYGSVIALLVLVVGTVTAIAAVAAGRAPHGVPPLVFLVVPLGDMVLFAVLLGAAASNLKRPEWHKRFMVCATLGILPAAFARIPLDAIQAGGLPMVFGLADLLLLGFVMVDSIKQRRLHPAYAWGLGLVVLSQAGRFALAGTPQWLAFAKWLTT